MSPENIQRFTDNPSRFLSKYYVYFCPKLFPRLNKQFTDSVISVHLLYLVHTSSISTTVLNLTLISQQTRILPIFSCFHNKLRVDSTIVQSGGSMCGRVNTVQSLFFLKAHRIYAIIFPSATVSTFGQLPGVIQRDIFLLNFPSSLSVLLQILTAINHCRLPSQGRIPVIRKYDLYNMLYLPHQTLCSRIQ